VPFERDLVVEGDFGYESGFRGAGRMLDLPEPPTAVFAADDQMALGVYEAVRRRGLRFPEDVSVSPRTSASSGSTTCPRRGGRRRR
jgi:LacI family transcriptional regulator